MQQLNRNQLISKRYVPPAFGREPTTPAEALEAAACVLEEEGRWVQSEWFHHRDPDNAEYADNPFCNGWSACADGALQLVTIGAFRRREAFEGWFISSVYGYYFNDPEGRKHYELYRQAREVIDRSVHTGLTRFNDTLHRTREEVVAALREGAKLAAAMAEEEAA